MKNKAKTAALAVALAAGTIAASTNEAEAFLWGNKDKVELVHCYGVNKCKGHNDCKTAENACHGHSKCKGHGFVAVPAAACDHLGGRIGK